MPSKQHERAQHAPRVTSLRATCIALIVCQVAAVPPAGSVILVDPSVEEVVYSQRQDGCRGGGPSSYDYPDYSARAFRANDGCAAGVVSYLSVGFGVRHFISLTELSPLWTLALKGIFDLCEPQMHPCLFATALPYLFLDTLVQTGGLNSLTIRCGSNHSGSGMTCLTITLVW